MDLAPTSAPTSVSNQPPASRPRDLPASARPHFPKRSLEVGFVEARQVAHFADAERVQILLHDLADAGNLADVERREEVGLLAGNDPQHAVGLGLIGGDLGDQARGGDPDGAVQAGVGLHALVQRCAARERRTVQALGAGHVEIGFVDRRHFDLRRERAAGLCRPSRSIRGSARDGRRRRWRAGTAWRRCAGAWRNARRTCAPRRRRRRPRRARRAARRRRRPCLSATGSKSSSTETKKASISTWKIVRGKAGWEAAAMPLFRGLSQSGNVEFYTRFFNGAIFARD